ncbi:MAG: hypothetical protein LC745_10500, partial [Planctomycetia bacterium]|nr:hypothetical protein [Planctomycetia bacterium]
AAVRAARGASVQAEISQIAQALADFKNKFGDYPPSRILINESGAVNTASSAAVSTTYNDVSVGQLYQRTVTAFHKVWPRVQFGNGAAAPGVNGTTVFFDFNGNGLYDDTLKSPGTTSYFLQGHQCLVFFLGGIPQPDPNNPGRFLGVAGFGKNPQNPFSNNVVGAAMYNGNRTPPLFEFNAGRLQPVLGSGGTPVNGMPGYTDSLGSSTTVPPQNFYAYFSTNNGSGYDPNDVNVLNNPETDSKGTAIALAFSTSFPVVTSSGGVVSPGATLSPSPNPYTSGSSAGASVGFLNPQTFQIISPGGDGLYGVGGAYDSAATAGALPREDTGGKYANSNSSDALLRTTENDNLTNFHNGKLQ